MAGGIEACAQVVAHGLADQRHALQVDHSLVERRDEIEAAVGGQYLQVRVERHHGGQVPARIQHHIAARIQPALRAGRVDMAEIPMFEGLVVQVGEGGAGGKQQVLVEILVPHRRVFAADGGHGRVVAAGVGIDLARDAGVDGGDPAIVSAQRHAARFQQGAQEQRVALAVVGGNVQAPGAQRGGFDAGVPGQPAQGGRAGLGELREGARVIGARELRDLAGKG